MTNEDYLEMTDEELAELNLSDEKLAEIYLEQSIECCSTALRLAENCFQKFGIRLLSDSQREIYERVIKNRVCLTDEEIEILENEQITSAMKSAKQARKFNKQEAKRLGEAYSPELTFQDKTDIGIN